ncbi:pyridoxine 5'-phosphate synthase [Hansschlegelia beijingensis]
MVWRRARRSDTCRNRPRDFPTSRSPSSSPSAADQADRAAREFERLASAAARAAQIGLEVHAGHGLDYVSAEMIAGLPEIAELNIGHFLIGEALAVGLPEAVRTMKSAIARGRRRAAA